VALDVAMAQGILIYVKIPIATVSQSKDKAKKPVIGHH